MGLKDSGHFVELGDLPVFDSTASFGEVYEVLGDRGRGGFLLMEQGRISKYVKATDLSGNDGRSDALADITTDCTALPATTGCDKPLTIGDQPHDISVDVSAPDMLSAETGRN